MKPAILTLALAAGISVVAPSAANAGIPYGTNSNLSFVADLGGGDSLCHYTVKDHVAYVGYWIQSKGYVVAIDRCDTTMYWDISAAEIAQFQSAGVLPADLPIEPNLTLQEMGKGFFWLILAGLIAPFAITKKIREMRGGGRGSPKGITPAALNSVLAAMCHTAKSDGHVDPSEAQTIASITSQLTGKSQNIDNIRIMIDQAVSNLQPHQFTAFGEGLSEDEKHLVLKASLMVAVADGKIEESEHTFVSNLAHAFRITGDQMRAMLHVIAPTRHTA